MKWLDNITDSMDMKLSKLQQTVKDKGSLQCCSPWGHRESDPTEPLSVTMPNFKPLWQWETSWEQSQPDFIWSLTLVTKVICFS